MQKSVIAKFRCGCIHDISDCSPFDPVGTFRTRIQETGNNEIDADCKCATCPARNERRRNEIQDRSGGCTSGLTVRIIEAEL